MLCHLRDWRNNWAILKGKWDINGGDTRVKLSRAHTSTRHQYTSDACFIPWESHSVKDSEKGLLDPSVYQDHNRKLKRSSLPRDPSCIQVWWKPVRCFYCVQTGHQTDTGDNITSLAEVIVYLIVKSHFLLSNTRRSLVPPTEMWDLAALTCDVGFLQFLFISRPKKSSTNHRRKRLNSFSYK